MAYFMPSSRKTKSGEPSNMLISEDGHAFTLKDKTKVKKNWRCVKYYSDWKCKVLVYTNLEVSLEIF